MKIKNKDYSLFEKFINQYEPAGFKEINRKDSLMIELEEVTQGNNQFFFIADLFKGEVIFTSEGSKKNIGVNPNDFTPLHGIDAVHAEELNRNTNGWAKLIQMGNELFLAQEGSSLLSVNMKMRNPNGDYIETLIQANLFFSKTPVKTVYDFQVFTQLDSFGIKNPGFHHYVGTDMSNFRYPDVELLAIGIDLTNRELEIVKWIEAGLNTKQIAKKLFVSPFTINAHRANILKKCNKHHVSDVIYELKQMGVL